MDVDNNDKLSVQRVAGGSVINHEPIFSLDGEILFVIWDNVVRAYSAQTGEWIRDLEGATAEIVNLQSDPETPELVYACTVTGQVVSWKWKSGVVHENISIKFPYTTNGYVRGFNRVDMGDKLAYALVVWSVGSKGLVKLNIFDLVKGADQGISLNLDLTSEPIHVDVSNVHHYLAMSQGYKLHIKSFVGPQRQATWNNADQKAIGVVRCHPDQEMIATGDVQGRIFMWYDLFNKNKIKNPKTRLYHWHSSGVNALAFTESGSGFYSGSNEPVLVRWNLNQSDEKSFLPRVSGSIVHVAISANNAKIAMATNDNGIQIMNPEFKPISVVQNFTWVAEDDTVHEKFPIGLKVNPRTSSLMLNGRIGQLQFFSTHTRSLLHNLDTAAQNRLSKEDGRVLYNVCITHSAINMDWIATGELLDDQVNSIELRLKFWRFDAERQTYVLNTQVELPHEHGLTAIEFSSAYSTELLLCATAGKDNLVKIWALQDSLDVNKPGKYWSCIGKTNYKNLPVNSLAFSCDGSLLSVGFGNTLCVYQPETLRLKCVLSCPAGLDGTANKITINLPTPVEQQATPLKAKSPKRTSLLKDPRSQLKERRQKLFQVVKSFLDSNDTEFVKNINNKLSNRMNTTPLSPKTNSLSTKEQEYVHKKVMSHTELNFYQKIELFSELSLRSKGPASIKPTFDDYVKRNLSSTWTMEQSMMNRAADQVERNRFSAARKIYNYKKRIGSHGPFDWNGIFTFEDKSIVNGKSVKKEKSEKPYVCNANPVKCVAQIKHVVFGSGENSHLVIVCTERRLLVWNLLTLRLQTAIKLSVHRLSVDPYTSLVAAFTVYNELYVFLPNAPYPLYQRKNLPDIHGAAWIPRRYPKSQTLNLDWQATSQLFFLSTKQELLQLVNDSDQDSLVSSAAYLQDGNQPMTYTPFGALIARQTHNAAKGASGAGKPDVGKIVLGQNGKSSVKEIIGLQTHTMAPVNLLCKGFLRSLADSGQHRNKTRSQTQQPQDANDGDVDDDMQMLFGSHNGDADVLEDDPVTKAKLESRKKLATQKTNLKSSKHAPHSVSEELALDQQLRQLMQRTISLRD